MAIVTKWEDAPIFNKRIDNSMLKAFRLCPMYFYLKYVKGFVSPNTSIALYFGSMAHYILDEYYQELLKSKRDLNLLQLNEVVELGLKKLQKDYKDKTVYRGKEGEEPDYRNEVNGIKLFLQYVEEYAGEREFYDIISCEQMVDRAIPDTDWTYTGKVDLTLEDKETLEVILVDHKTTGGNISQQIEDHKWSNQFLGYLWLSDNIFYQSNSFMVNFLKCSSRRSPITKKFGKLSMSFYRATNHYTCKDIRDFEESLISDIQRLDDILKNKKPFLRNRDNCTQYGKPCTYSSYCYTIRGNEGLEKPYNYIQEWWSV